MARGIGGLVKAAAGSVAQIPGAEEIVLAAVRDIFKELKQLRKENARLTNEVTRLRQRLDAGAGRRAAAVPTPVRSRTTATRAGGATRGTTTRGAAKRSVAKRSSAPVRRSPQRRGGILGDLLG